MGKIIEQGVAEIVLRIIYFFIGFLGLPLSPLALAAVTRGGIILFPFHWYFHPLFWLIALIVGILSALFGPRIYQKETQRGRGTLAEVRRLSGRNE